MREDREEGAGGGVSQKASSPTDRAVRGVGRDGPFLSGVRIPLRGIAKVNSLWICTASDV
jgi:hypothetical protein